LNIKGNDLLSLLVSQYILQKDLLVVSDKEKKLSNLQEKLDAFNLRISNRSRTRGFLNNEYHRNFGMLS